MNWLAALVFGLVVTQIAILDTTIYLHRGLAHRALTSFNPKLEFTFRFFIWITTGMKPAQWAAIHQQHHADTDGAWDPHSPIVDGFWRVQLGNVGLYRTASKWPKVMRREALIRKSDRWDTMLFDHAFRGLAIGISILVIVTTLSGFGPWTGLAAAGFHTVFYIMLSGAINACGHRIGTQPYDVTSATNVPGLSIVTGGEGLHNNHHGDAADWRFSRHWWQIDPARPIIRILRTARLLKFRDEVAKLSEAA